MPASPNKIQTQTQTDSIISALAAEPCFDVICVHEEGKLVGLALVASLAACASDLDTPASTSRDGAYPPGSVRSSITTSPGSDAADTTSPAVAASTTSTTASVAQPSTGPPGNGSVLQDHAVLPMIVHENGEFYDVAEVPAQVVVDIGQSSFTRTQCKTCGCSLLREWIRSSMR